MTDTWTPKGQEKRRDELVEDYKKKGNKVGLVRLIGGSVEDLGQETGYEAGEPPQGAQW